MDRNQAFALLHDAVVHAQSQGALTYSAGLKPRMQQLSNGGFSEVDLGYESFRAFLEDAREQGLVQILPVPGGDIEVLLPGQSPSSRPSHRPIARRIREDLWKAFVTWEDGTARLFDKTARHALILTEEQASAVQSNEPDRYLVVTPLTRTQTQDIMRDFLATVPTGDRDRLESALSSEEEPERKFVDSMTLETRRAWRRFQVERIEEHIRRWAQEANINIDISAPLVRHTQGQSRLTAQSPSSSSGRGDMLALRKHLLAALGRMTLSELLRLPIPAEYLIDQSERDVR